MEEIAVILINQQLLLELLLMTIIFFRVQNIVMRKRNYVKSYVW